MKRSIDTVEARSRLKPRRAPYWVRLDPGVHLGFCRLTASSPGAWHVKVEDNSTGIRTQRSLGTFEALQPSARYSAAKKAAEALQQHVEVGGSADGMTVLQACEGYVAHLRADGRHAAADDAGARFARWVTGDKLGRVDLRKLAPHHLRTWRRGLAGTDVVINPHADEVDQRTRERSASSINRDMTTLRAALNLAREGGAVGTDAAWRAALKPAAGADRPRGLYLDRQQRAELVKHAPTDLAALLRGLALVPLRPGAMAALTVASLDKRVAMLTVGTDKAGADRRLMLPPATLAFFVEQTKGKLPGAPLFARADGKAWDKDAWKKPVKAAAAAAGLPGTTTAYTLRHGVITDLVGGGLDVLTAARLSGTSVSMIERHYGHLRAEAAAAALATLAL